MALSVSTAARALVRCSSRVCEALTISLSCVFDSRRVSMRFLYSADSVREEASIPRHAWSVSRIVAGGTALASSLSRNCCTSTRLDFVRGIIA